MDFIKSVTLVELILWIATKWTALAQETSFFMVTSEYCITNGSSAMSFISPFDNTNSLIESTPYPNSDDHSGVGCKMEENDGCNHLWTLRKWALQKSLDGKINQLITDWRWEGLGLTKTMPLYESTQKIRFYKIATFSQGGDFKIPLSIRMEKEAHVFLCDGDDVTKSNCYWVMLHGWNGTKSALRICSSGDIYDRIDVWPKNPCKTPVKEYAHPTGKFLRENEWTHFEIIKNGKSFEVISGTKKILETNIEKAYSPRYILFHSRVNGVWKLHKSNYIYTEEQTSERLGPENIRLKQGQNCFSMFIVTCKTCHLFFRFLAAPYEDTYQRTLYNRGFNTVDEKWTEIKLLVYSHKEVDTTLHVMTASEETSGTFWAIDNVRPCNRIEHRILKYYPSLPCQLIKNGRVLEIDYDESSRTDSNCPEDTFGSSCTPCQLFGSQYCSNFKYCEIVGGFNTVCRCSSGYDTRDCSLGCSPGYYGHGCSKTCGHCECLSVNGYCKYQCQNNFQGPKCDIPPEGLLNNPPDVLDVYSTSFVVQVNNFETSGSTIPLHYRIQYKKTEDLEWKNTLFYHDYNVNVAETIDNLEPDTEYYVRTVLFSTTNSIFEGDYIKKRIVRTTCTHMSQQDITITPKNTFITITFKTEYFSCNVFNYQYGLDNILEGNITMNPLKLFNLPPCKEYELYLTHLYSNISTRKKFRSKMNVPSAINKVIINSQTATEAVLTWEKPTNQYCPITHYLVAYKRIRALSCAFPNPSNYVNTSVAESRVVLKDLVPYSYYEVKISTVNDAGIGKEFTSFVTTLGADDFDENEIPYPTSYSAAAFKITIYLNKLDCNNKRGDHYLKVVVKCQTEWCSFEKPKEYIFLNIESMAVTALHPYVNYTIDMKVSRFKENWNSGKSLKTSGKLIATTPTEPLSIMDVTVISKDENYIHLRWLPPHPPTGILQQYKIEYTEKIPYRVDPTFTEYVKPTRCRLWPSHHCVIITKNIHKGSTYSLEISAKNKAPNNFVKVSPKKTIVTASVGVPDPPYDVGASWTERNTLNVSWKHPNITNGMVKDFTIQLLQNNLKQKTIKRGISSENEYNLTYSFEIEKPRISWCSSYTIQFRTENRAYTSGVALIKESYSPPPIPTIPNEALKVESTNRTIIVQIPNLKQEEDGNLKTKVYLLISVSTNEYDVSEELSKFEVSLRKTENALLEIYNSRLVLVADGNLAPSKFQIGDLSSNFTQRNLSNPPLDPGREYSISLFYVNTCHGKIRLGRWRTIATTVNSKKQKPKEEDQDPASKSNNGLYALLLLLLLVPIGMYIYMRRNKESALRSMRYLIYPQRERHHSNALPLVEKSPMNEPKPMVKPQTVPNENTRYVLKTTHSKPIKICNYESYVKDAIESGELERQHALFPRGQTKPWEYGSIKANKSKNRYNNLIAYDHTRVKLRKIAGVDYSDYINANYIDGYRSPRSYIATQGPKASTVNDFWRMIWQQKVENIVMLANIYEGGKKKVEKYWPDINEENDFYGIRVQYVSSEVFADYEYRIFNVHNNGEQRKVEQLHFSSWPDHGVPLYSQSLVPFLQRILKIPNSPNHPVVFHCSAGVGRTGTIILCDICLRMAAGEGSIDFLANLEHLRSQRPNMVDNIEQYKLVHLVVLECLFGMQTHIPCDDAMGKNVDNLLTSGGIRKYMKYLEDTKWQDKAMDTVWDEDEIAPVYPEKNRFGEIIPDQNHRVFISRYPVQDETSSYINAVRVDGFRNPGRFIVTQQPMPNTLGDFWRLVNERKSTVVISLNEISKEDKTSCQFWPTNSAEITPVDLLTLRHVNTVVRDCYDLITVHLIPNREGENLSVTIISMKNWMPGELLPNNIEHFLSFWEESDPISRKTDTVIITCYDGATASGLYIAMSFVIEKMKLEHVCDVCLAVRNIRHNRFQFVTSEEQFEFLYRASVTYIKGFQSYANFS